MNTTTTGGGHMVLVCGRTCRALLRDKGNPYLTGDKGTHTDEHGPKSCRFMDVQTGDNITITKKRRRAWRK